MILPPFFGISSKYDEAKIRQAILDYLSLDVSVFSTPSKNADITFITLDATTFSISIPTTNITYLTLDALSISELSKSADVTFNTVDVLTYDPPPAVPEITRFISIFPEDSLVELSWNTPYARRSPILEYILQYSTSFRSNILSENNYSLITENNDHILDEVMVYFNLLDEDLNLLLTESSEAIIGDAADDYHYRWYTYDKEILLTDNREDRLNTQSALSILTEKSAGVGLTNFTIATNLMNDQPYIFRIAAINAIGTGEFGYSDIVIMTAPSHKYCDIIVFIQPDSTTDIFASLIDHSCREKTITHIEGVTTSNQSKFGAGSLYFNGQYDDIPSPGTYSHLQVDHNNALTTDDWSLKGDFTIELWIKPDSSNTYSVQTLASSQHQNSYDSDYYDNKYTYWKLYRYQNSIRFKMNIEEYLFYEPYSIYENIELVANNINLSTNEFTHIAVSRFKNYIRLFVNGVRYDRKFFDKDVIINQSNNPYMIIGANQTDSYLASDEFNLGRGSTTEPYQGHIDDFMLSKAARYVKNFIPVKYDEPAECLSCGGYVSIFAQGVVDDLIP